MEVKTTYRQWGCREDIVESVYDIRPGNEAGLFSKEKIQKYIALLASLPSELKKKIRKKH